MRYLDAALAENALHVVFDVGRQIQSKSLEFDLLVIFYSLRCWHVRAEKDALSLRTPPAVVAALLIHELVQKLDRLQVFVMDLYVAHQCYQHLVHTNLTLHNDVQIIYTPLVSCGSGLDARAARTA